MHDPFLPAAAIIHRSEEAVRRARALCRESARRCARTRDLIAETRDLLSRAMETAAAHATDPYSPRAPADG